MENLKKARSTLRGLFTKSVNKLEDYIHQGKLSRKDLNTLMVNVEQKASQIADLDGKINQLMMASEQIETGEFETEYESCFVYESKLNECRCTVEDLLHVEERKHDSENESVSVHSTTGGRGKTKKYKLPKIEITKFGGDIKEWLTWWAQFEKIHEDKELADEDKFHYLRQSTVENSKAREVVDSFPMTGTNYPKVITHLTNRFGNKDTLVEVYVRELLKLVLSNGLNPTKKVSVSTLYDKVEAQLRSLESLDVTTDSCAAILYPLVASCLPEDLLRAWERHRIVPHNQIVSSHNNIRADRLSNIMTFLRGEVENEERISLARSGFAEHSKKQKKDDKVQEIPTAAGLFTRSQSKSQCIFCNGNKHSSKVCLKARRNMTLDEKNKIIESHHACFICIEIGHQAKNCPKKSSIICDICDGTHYTMMCKRKSQSNAASSSEVVEKKTNVLWAAPPCIEEVVLSTMMIRIRNGKQKLVIRAAIDSGSHKTYMLKSLIKKLGLIKNGEEILAHELFGGHTTKQTVHNRYSVLAENLSGTYSQTFDVLDQDRICHSVPKLKKGPWIEELQEKGIELTDFGTGSAEIELLIGSNVAGTLLTDLYKFNKNGSGSGMVALNYSIGWALMGEISNNRSKSDATLLVQTLFVQELDVSNLWRLDVIGIEDSAETMKKEKCIEAANQCFKETSKINDEGRYEIALPFINGSPRYETIKLWQRNV